MSCSESELLRCPECRRSMRLSVTADEQQLVCSKAHAFSVVRGVPRFVQDADYAESFGHQWNRWATTQMDSVNGTTIFRDRFTRYFGPPEQLAGLRVLDAGCGVGAFVELVAPHAAEVVGFDLSTAVEAAQCNVGGLTNVHIMQADIYRPPLDLESFDFVYSIGVLQHTPDPEHAFASLAGLVRPRGRLGVWIYERAPFEPLKPRHLVRRYSSRLDGERAMKFAERYAPRALRVRRGLARVPGLSWARKLVPVADIRDYAGDAAAQLSEEQITEWSLLDTHDMLITAHDRPQTAETVESWFISNGFEPPHRSQAEAVAMLGVKAA